MWRWDQGEPFGNDVPNNNPSGAGAFEFNLRFPGQYFDRETSLAYNYFRDYDPSVGRYVESDPIGLRGGINTYLYAYGDPLIFVDPKGLAVASEALKNAYSKTVGGIAGKKCSDNLSCDWYNRARPFQIDTATNDQCAFLIPSGSLGHNYLECRDACVFWLKEKCKQPPQSCGPSDSNV